MGPIRTAGVAGLLAIIATASACSPTTAHAPAPLGHGVLHVDPGVDAMDYTATVEDGDLIGGDAMRIIQAPFQAAVDILAQPDALWILMPRVASMAQVGGSDDDRRYEVVHALGPVTGGYTMRFVRQRSPGDLTVWFWVDTTRPRDLEFAWGALRLMPLGRDRTMMSYQVRIELSAGIAKWMLEARIRRAALSVADRAQALIEDRVRYLPPMGDVSPAE